MNDLSARIQESNATEFNRYPSIFSIVREISIDRGKDCGIEVLSFGCSSGEEVASLDSIYLENSKLVGVDVSYSAIAKAKQYQPTGRNDCTFFHSGEFNYSWACPRFCVNGSPAGNCHLTWRHHEFTQT